MIPWWTALWGFLTYAFGTWWGKAYVLATFLAATLFVLEELHNIRKYSDVPGLESSAWEGVPSGLFMGLFWPLFFLILVWAGLRKALAALGRGLARLDK